MSGIVPFGSGGLDRLPKSTSRALEHVRGNGLVTAARVEAVAFVTHVGLQEIELLSMQEAMLVERCPHAAGRARALVDQFTAAAAAEVAGMRFRS